MAGTFGYELDINALTQDDKEQIKEQVEVYKRNYNLINTGEYYRLSSPYDNDIHTSWQMVSQDKIYSLVSVVFHQAHGNANFYNVCLRGLDENAFYQVNGEEVKYTGAALMYAGLVLPNPWGDYESYQFEIKMCEE